MNKQTFYDKIRVSLFSGALGHGQVEGMEAILNECFTQGVTDPRQIACIMGNIFHEVAGTMQPIEEFGKGKNRTYGHRVWYNGKPYNDIQTIFYGRGFTQNTWRDIYVKLSVAAQKKGYAWDFVNHPELLLEVGPSAWATVYAMKFGLYTGRKLSDYFNTNTTDFVMSRAMVNGKRKGEKYPDKAELIAGYSKKFLDAVS